MSYRRKPTWIDVVVLGLSFIALAAIQVFVVWIAFNFLGRAFNWPRIDFWQAGAMWVLSRALFKAAEMDEKKS